jgi:hypothetical protein
MRFCKLDVEQFFEGSGRKVCSLMKSSNVETDVRRRTAAKEESYSEFRAIFIFGFHSDFC